MLATAEPAPSGASPTHELAVGLGRRRREIVARIGELDREAADLGAERGRVRRALTQAEEARVLALDNLHLANPEVVAQAMRASRDLYVRLQVLEARISGVAARRDGLAAELQVVDRLRELAGRLEADPALARIRSDDPRVLCRRAERELTRLIGDDHDMVVEQIMGGPIEELADIALAAELIGRRVGRAPAAQVAGEVAECRRTALRALERLQRLLFRVSPLGLTEEGLAASVRRVLADLGGSVSTRVQVVGEEPALPPGVAMAGFRMVLGAVDNAIRHGGAAEVEVVLSFSRRRLHVLVCDRGEGFDVAAAEARLGRARGWGLVGMRARVENAGGTFEIRSAPGAGTEVRSVFDLSGS